MFFSQGSDEGGQPLNVVDEVSFANGALFATGHARAYESTLLMLVDDDDPIVIPVDPDGGWSVNGEARIGSSVAIGDEDAKTGGMSPLTTISLTVDEQGEVVAT